MPDPASIFGEVEAALQDASGARRIAVLRRVTDLFVEQSAQYSQAQTEVFDGVLGHLIKHIESKAIVELSARMAPLANAPVGTVRALAKSDDIEVSGPILAHSPRLSDGDLIEIARTKSQAHLERIAGRTRLNVAVTDVLVDHGNPSVAHRLAQNAGATFSNSGMAKLVMRSDGDDELTESLARRADIPPHHFQNLLSQATEAVREKLLLSAPPERQREIRNIVAQISMRMASRAIPFERYAEARRVMAAFGDNPELLKAKIYEFSLKKRVAEVTVGLSMLSTIPVEELDRLFSVPNVFGLLAVCRSATLDWQSAWAIIMISASAGILKPTDIEELGAQYEVLSSASAQRLLRFWQTRQKLAKTG
jgi:uncharacterized protein (DUF2336 family)